MSRDSLLYCVFFVFFFNDTATTEIYTLSLHDALPISAGAPGGQENRVPGQGKRIAAAARQQAARQGIDEIGRAHV